MKYLLYILCYLASLLCISSCGGGPGFSDTPEISFISISKDTMRQGLFKDSLSLMIGFRDGDGDLGSKPDDSNLNIILTDSRTNEIYDGYRIPDLDISGAQSGIEGEITLKVATTCCIFPESTGKPPCDTSTVYPINEFSLAIKLVDDSAKESNTINTPVITLVCK